MGSSDVVSFDFSQHGPLVVAHRGGAALVPHENTMEAFTNAIAVGAPMAELDVRRTVDGELVVFHDAEIDGAALSTLTFAELCARTRGQGFEPPRLGEVLELGRGSILLDIELKEAGYEGQVMEAILTVLPPCRFVVKSFEDSTVAEVARRWPEVTCGLLLGLDAPRWDLVTRWGELFPRRRLGATGARFVSPHEGLVRLGFVRRMARLGLPVLVWTVNDEPRMRELLRLGVAGLVTDRPDLALRCLGD